MGQGSRFVSIVMPAYNAAKYIEYAVNSVIAQTHKEWELLVVNDCSNDNTQEVLDGLVKNESRIRLIKHEYNLGVVAARNTALDAAEGAMVAFLDSDDAWLPGKLDEQLNAMNKFGYGFTFTAFRRMSDDGVKTGRLRLVPLRLTYRELLKNTAIVTSSVVIDRNISGDFRMPSVGHEDFATWLSILKRDVVANGLNSDLVRYRVAPKSLSRNKARSVKWIWGVYRNCEGLSLGYAAWCFANYAIRGYLKNRHF